MSLTPTLQLGRRRRPGHGATSSSTPMRWSAALPGGRGRPLTPRGSAVGPRRSSFGAVLAPPQLRHRHGEEASGLGRVRGTLHSHEHGASTGTTGLPGERAGRRAPAREDAADRAVPQQTAPPDPPPCGSSRCMAVGGSRDRMRRAVGSGDVAREDARDGDSNHSVPLCDSLIARYSPALRARSTGPPGLHRDVDAAASRAGQASDAAETPVSERRRHPRVITDGARSCPEAGRPAPLASGSRRHPWCGRRRRPRAAHRRCAAACGGPTPGRSPTRTASRPR